jgi:GntR family transcriptional regulator/MocR family aminotransferase
MQKIGSVQRVCEIFRLKIHAGELSPGEKLPSTRALASDLGVSRSTVVTVYEQLASEGYIETAPGSRARVSLTLPRPAKAQRPSLKPIQSEQRKLSAYGRRTSALNLPVTPEIKLREINFLYGAIADEDFPRLMWRKLYNQALMKRQASLYYDAPEGGKRFVVLSRANHHCSGRTTGH